MRTPHTLLSRQRAGLAAAAAAATLAIGGAAAAAAVLPASVSTNLAVAGDSNLHRAAASDVQWAAPRPAFPAVAGAGSPPAVITLATVATDSQQPMRRAASALRPAAASRPAEPSRSAAARHVVRPAPGHLSRHSPCGTSALHRWICGAESIMAKHGTPRSAIDTGAAFIVVMHESGGNPRARNGWDSNAAAGSPSEGIAQTIRPTFEAYALPGHRNIWDPVDNMVAAFRYAIGRYGSMNNIPGVVAVRQGGSYVGY